LHNIAKIYRRLRPVIPTGLKIQLRTIIEYLFDVGAKKYYSQFGEDAVLQGYFEAKAWRKDKESFSAFLKPRLEASFYVDVGAYAPKQYSNTYWFYKRGWRGINIDATPNSMRAFNLIRKRDINLEMAVSNRETDCVFYCWGVPCVINTLSPELAHQWTREFDKPPYEMRVQSLRLDTILDRYLPTRQRIGFLSVDVEGHDLEVLRSNDWRRYRPELVVVEQHKEAISEILESDITRFLEEVGYSVCSWINPSVIYRANDWGSAP
jgi:FkbM family methyltransferase